MRDFDPSARLILLTEHKKAVDLLSLRKQLATAKRRLHLPFRTSRLGRYTPVVLTVELKATSNRCIKQLLRVDSQVICFGPCEILSNLGIKNGEQLQSS